MDRSSHKRHEGPYILVEAAPTPIVAAVIDQMGLAATPAGPQALYVAAPPEVAPHLAAALVSAGAEIYLITARPRRPRPHRRAACHEHLPCQRFQHQPASPPAPPRRGIMTPFTEVILGNGLLKRFATIRWKLTGAFLAVSLLLALTMIAIFVAGVVYILNAPIIPQAIGQSARELAAFVSEDLASGGEPDQLIGTLKRLANASARKTKPSGGQDPAGVDVQIDAPSQGDEVLIALVNTQGRVITTTHPLSYAAGVSIAAVEPLPAGDLLSRALQGITNTEQLTAWNTPEHQPIAVAPIVGPEGQIIGVIYLRLVNFPAMGLFLANLTPFLATFIVPWLLVSGGMGMIYSWLVGRGFARRIARLTEASIDLSDGDLSLRIEDPSRDELGQLGRQFNAMADQLSESLRSLRLLADRNAQLAEQTAQLAAVEERNRLARELHDSVSQELFSLTMLAAAARRTLDGRPDLTAARLVEIEESARRALEETRSLIFALRPAALDGRGLTPALHDLVAALRERQGLSIDLRVTGERRLPLEYEQALYRIIQEALANVARHSGVRSAVVTLRYESETVALDVRDGGRGFDLNAARNPRSIGLQSMAERAEALGGTLELRSSPGAGTTISVVIPISRDSHKESDSVLKDALSQR
ncbi:MAG: sensor histidine kinase [Chloroflexales bacterium]|nr:sensor histidine kinase [Chloroflexales bacterium]